MQSIYIPASLKSIGLAAFGECNNLTDIYYGGTAEEWAMIEGNSEIPFFATVHFNSVP